MLKPIRSVMTRFFIKKTKYEDFCHVEYKAVLFVESIDVSDEHVASVFRVEE
jgi:hypothetical protein